MSRDDFGAWLFRSSSFCCCIPVRAGFVLMSILTFLLSGAISVIIWFEIHSSQLTSKERMVFFSTGIVETLLCVVSIIGFIGVVARKQLFVTIYAYFLYIHFVINIIVGIYFLVTLVRANDRQQLVDYCAEALANTSAESSCSRLMNVSTYVFIAIVAALLLLELYGVLIAVRYVYRLRIQKRDGRSRRLGYFHALANPETSSGMHARHGSDDIELLHPQESRGDPRDIEDPGVLDIRPDYAPVPTYDRDWPPAQTPRSIPDSLPDGTPSQRVRALPPLPVSNQSSTTSGISGRTGERSAQLGRLPNPFEPLSKRHEPQTPDSDDRHSLYTTEVSSTTHAALMDHASYMRSTFSNPPPAPVFSSRSLR